MTISSQTRKAGPFIGAGSTGPFAFTFKVFQASDLLVVTVNTSTNVETTLTLTTNYTVSLNSDQNTSPGGSVTLVAPLAVGNNMVISSQVPYLQETDLTNQGGFYPEVITDALDKLTIEVQQVKGEADRAAKLPITSDADPDALVADIVRLADSADNIDTVANNIGNVNTVAGVASDIPVVAANVTDINNFADVWQGAFASDPANRTTGGALQTGDLYFNTSVDQVKVWNGSAWVVSVTDVSQLVAKSGDTMTGNLLFTNDGALGLPVGTVAERPTAVKGMIRFNDDDDQFEGYDGTQWAGIGGGGAAAELITSSQSVQAGKQYRITAGSAVTITLPAAPATGDVIRLMDGESISDTVTHVVNRNGNTIMGLSENLNLNVIGIDFQIWYNGSDWRLF